MDKRTLTFISLILLIFIVAGGLIWYFIFKKPSEPAPLIDNTNDLGDFSNDFFPVSEESSNETTTNQNQNNTSIPGIRKISSEPTAGHIEFVRQTTVPVDVFSTSTQSVSTTTETVYRFVERATGHIYETTDRTMTIRKVSNTTIPKIYDAKFSPDGNSVIYTYLNNLGFPVYYSAKIDGYVASTADSVGGLKGSFLPNSIIDLIVSPNGKNIAFGRLNESGYTDIITSSFDGLGSKIVASLPTSEWLLAWPSTNIITAQSKATNKEYGHIYNINTATGGISKVLGDKNGLLASESRDGSLLIFSETPNNNIELKFLDTKTKGEKYTGYVGLAEKCSWKNQNQKSVICGIENEEEAGMPDLWYQGYYSFNDDIYELDYANNKFSNLVLGSDFDSEGIDVVKQSISPDDKYFVFINKKDLSLWSVVLPN